MVSINASREVSAPADRVWDIIADMDNDPHYWNGLNAVHNINKKGNVIVREVTVGFMNHKGRQTVVLNPKKSVETKMTDGPMIGTRIIELSPSGENKTKVDVSWNFKFSGIPPQVHSMVKMQLEEGTETALSKIAKAVE